MPVIFHAKLTRLGAKSRKYGISVKLN